MKKSFTLLLLFGLLTISVIFFSADRTKERIIENRGVKEGILKEEGGSEEEQYNLLAEAIGVHQSCNLFPVRNNNVVLPQTGERAGIAVFFNDEGKGTILYETNVRERLPIASLTKLMSAMIIIDRYPLDQEIVVSQRDVWTEGESGRLSPGEKITIKNLLYLSLLVSSNDASSALAEVIGEKKFVDLMNLTAKNLGLLSTHFANPHGLDDKENFSTAEDLVLLTQHLLLYYPSIWDILKIKEIDIISRDHLGNRIIHHTRNTNKLISEEKVLGGKTGYTEEAKDTMILATKSPGKVNGNIILVLLGVDDRIQRMRELYNWLEIGYSWQ